MMARPTLDNERHRLLSGWCDGVLTDAEFHRLDELMRTDAGFRELYLMYMDQHAVLAAAVLPIGDVRLTVQHPGAYGDEADGGGDAIRAESGSVFQEERAGHFPRVPHAWRRWIAAAAIAALVLAGTTARQWSTGRSGPAIVASPPSASDPPRLGLARGFAVVVQLSSVEWEPGQEQRPSEGDLLAGGRRLLLRSGQMTLGLLSGVTLTVEGPADLELLSIDRVHCRRGKLRTSVPRGAEGFVVTTPGSAVVDLGTEFGLNVSDDGKARMMVFKGEAEAAVLNEAGAPIRSQQATARRALAIDPQSGRIEEAAAHTVEFVEPTAPAPRPLVLDASYRDAVMAAGPLAYWRFETMDGGVVADEVTGRRPLRAIGTVKLVGEPGGNHGLEFSPDEAEQSVTMDALWEPPGDPGCALELWALPGRIGHAALVSLIAADPAGGDYKHLLLLEFTASDRQSLFSPGLVRFLYRWPPGSAGGDNLFSTRHYIPYRWHHIVAQRAGRRLELYVDGVAMRPVTLPSAPASEPCRLLLGRLKPEPRPPGRLHSRPFVGLIDELALYNRPLAAEEVRRHYELGTSGGQSSIPLTRLHRPDPRVPEPTLDSRTEASRSSAPQPQPRGRTAGGTR